MYGTLAHSLNIKALFKASIASTSAKVVFLNFTTRDQ